MVKRKTKPKELWLVDLTDTSGVRSSKNPYGLPMIIERKQFMGRGPTEVMRKLAKQVGGKYNLSEKRDKEYYRYVFGAMRAKVNPQHVKHYPP